MIGYCPICLSETEVFTALQGSNILKCINCGLGITENLKGQVSDYHRDESYIKEEKLFENIFQKRVNIMMEVVKPKTVLEIGCSTGLLLSLFVRKSCEVAGVELSKKATEVARSRGIEVILGDFLKVKIDKKFDLIIFNHTLEHVEDPVKFINQASAALNK